MTPALLLIGILVVASVLIIGVLTYAGSRDRRRRDVVPPAMRPGYADDQLESRVIERNMGWALVLIAFFAVFVPIYWVAEQGRIQDAEASLFTASVAEGEVLYQANCAQCHGSNAAGGAAPHPSVEGGTWPSPNLRNIVTRYEDNPHVEDVRDLIVVTLERGRPGSPMPAYGQAFQGPFTDAEIRAVTDWILVNQDEPPETEASAAATSFDGAELYAMNCANCHGPEGQGAVGPSLIGAFERHGEEGIAAILREGIVVGTGTTMPPFQDGWFYNEGRFDDAQLQAVIDYLEGLQPDVLPEGFELSPTPGVQRGPDDPPEGHGRGADTAAHRVEGGSR